MMTEISLNILDVAENSVSAGATLTEITVCAERSTNRLTVTIKDNGCGMNEEKLRQVTDPFFTTRTTRKVGLGIPFFKESAELAGGYFEIKSQEGVETTVTSVYRLDHIDRMPMGDIASTIHTLVTMHEKVDFRFTYAIDQENMVMDTREFREILGDISFREPEVSRYIKDYLKENIALVGEGL